MCGRYVDVAPTSDLTAEFSIDEVVGADVPPSWNVAPTDPVRIVVARHPSRDRDAAAIRQLRTVRWGLLPSWSKSRSPNAKMINARSETVTSKPAFRSAAARRRCLIPAQGYYEWMQQDSRKTPYFLHDPDDRMLAFAGLYEIWRDDALPEDDPNRWVWTCAIVTRAATDLLGEIHNRCPVLVPPELRGRWLDCGNDDPRVADRLIAHMPEPHLAPYRVSHAVGSVKNNGPELIQPVADRGALSVGYGLDQPPCSNQYPIT